METEPKAQDETSKYPGCVKRILNFMDRQLALEAVLRYWKKPPAGQDRKCDWRGNRKIKLVKDALDQESVIDYFEAMQDALADRIEQWQKEVRAYTKALQEGTPEDKLPPKPPRRQPRLTDEESCGKESVFWIKSVVDSHIIEFLREMDWKDFPVDDVDHVCEAFGMEDAS